MYGNSYESYLLVDLLSPYKDYEIDDDVLTCFNN